MINYDEFLAAFNAVEAKDKIVEWIRDWFAANAPENALAVVGISGGKDSSVCAALCVEALGRERVLGILMPNNGQNDIHYSYALIEHLGIKYIHHDIANEYGDILHNVWCNLIDNYDGVILPSKETKTELAPRLRMAVLYAYAQSLRGRVCCAMNLSEAVIGNHTHWGDSIGDFAPIACYTSDEVIAIGRVLGLPEELLVRVPRNEDNLGFTYRTLNEYIRLGQVKDAAAREKIDYLREINKFKREPIATFIY